MRALFFFEIILLLISFCGCAVNPVTGKREVMIFSESQEISFGKNADPDIRWEFGGVYNDDQLASYINSLGQRVASNSDRPKLPYYFTIVDSSVVNAFALPGGYIYITRGLLVRMDNEAQLAAVLGHEIGHVNARHSMKRLQNVLGFNLGMLFLDQVASGSENYQKWRGMLKTGSQVAFATVSLGYGRKDEHQADELGTRYASKAGFDPNGMIQLLELLKNLSDREPTAVEEFFMSHPRTSERIKSVNEVISKLPPEQRKGIQNRAEYKSKIKDLVEAQKAYDHYDKGEILQQKRNYNEALSEYNQAIALRNNIAKPYHGIGKVYYAQGKYNQAIEEYKKAISKDPDYIFAYNDLGVSLITTKQYEGALNYLKKAVQIYENYDDAWSNLGEAYYNLKQYPESIKSLEMAITLNENHPRAYTTLGLAYEASGNTQKAIESYEKAIKIAPKENYTNIARERLDQIKKNK
ncbi:MAG: M48 family metalloprotease [bacterium]